MIRPLRALVVGAGETSMLMHLPILARLRDEGRLELVEICDLRHERAVAARARFGFAREGGDAAAAIDRPDIDIVYLFGTAQLHHDHGMAAAEAGKHLFVEKPIAPSHAEACALASAAAKRGVVAAGGHNRRFYRSLDAIRAGGGRAGWRFAEAMFHKPEHGVSVPFGARSWLSANGIHALDALVWLMGGLPDHVATTIDRRGPAPGSFVASMQWANGAQGIFLCNNYAGARREEYAFHGMGETWRATDSGLVVERKDAVRRVDMPMLGDGFAAEHMAFLDAIRTGQEPLHALARLAPSLFLAELIEAGFSGPVRLPEVPIRTAPTVSLASSGKVLVVNPARIGSALFTSPLRHRLVSLEEVAASPGPRADIVGAVIASGPEMLTPDLLGRLPRLSIVGLVGLSFSRHRPDELLARGIMLVNASAAYAESVAEFALGLALLARRRAFASDQVMRGGGWGTALPPRGVPARVLDVARRVRPALAGLGLESAMRRAWKKAGLAAPAAANPGRELRGAIVGLIGWGANARAFTARLIGAGARVLVYSEHAAAGGIEAAGDIEAAGATSASLAEVLAADIVSLHRGLTRETRHGLSAAELDRLRPGAILINVARGALIEPAALLARLRCGDIFACLDSYEEEPLPRRHPLRRLPNVFLTSHIAGGSPDMMAAAGEEVVGKVAAYLDGRNIDTVTPERLLTMT